MTDKEKPTPTELWREVVSQARAYQRGCSPATLLEAANEMARAILALNAYWTKPIGPTPGEGESYLHHVLDLVTHGDFSGDTPEDLDMVLRARGEADDLRKAASQYMTFVLDLAAALEPHSIQDPENQIEAVKNLCDSHRIANMAADVLAGALGQEKGKKGVLDTARDVAGALAGARRQVRELEGLLSERDSGASPELERRVQRLEELVDALRRKEPSTTERAQERIMRGARARSKISKVPIKEDPVEGYRAIYDAMLTAGRTLSNQTVSETVIATLGCLEDIPPRRAEDDEEVAAKAADVLCICRSCGARGRTTPDSPCGCGGTWRAVVG
jgi:hypothetical protein